MSTQPVRGRRPALDCKKKKLLCDAVSRGATMTEAAVTVGVSLRTVQRAAQLDPEFDQELRIAHTDKPDPLAIMQSAARTHWRAAAWLLERTNPENYGRRRASSCTPFQFEEALKVVIDAALRLAPEENRGKVYAQLTAASETAFKAVFPNHAPFGRRLVERLPDTPLADEERLKVLGNPPPDLIVPDPFEASPQVGWVDRAAATHQEEPDPFAAPYLHPRPLPASPPPAAASVNQPTSSLTAPNLPDPNPTPALTPNRLPSSPNPDPRLPWQYNLRAACTNPTPPMTPLTLADPSIPSHLSPKTPTATEIKRSDNPLRNAPVSRDRRERVEPAAAAEPVANDLTHYEQVT